MAVPLARDLQSDCFLLQYTLRVAETKSFMPSHGPTPAVRSSEQETEQLTDGEKVSRKVKKCVLPDKVRGQESIQKMSGTKENVSLMKCPYYILTFIKKRPDRKIGPDR